MKWECKNCGSLSKNADPSLYGFCLKIPCKIARSKWTEANFDQLEKGNLRANIENDFWEPNEIQKEKYAYFYSMIRSKRPAKIRKCLRCRTTLNGKNTPYPENRMCTMCQEVARNVGVLAYS